MSADVHRQSDTEQPVTVYRLEGAGCLDCAREVEAAIAALPGVRRADLNATAGRLTVVGAADLAAIRRIAGAEGWQVIPPADSSDATTVYRLGGAGCLDCVDEVEDAIGALLGVRRVDLNATARRLTIVGRADIGAIRRIAGAEGWEVYEPDATGVHGSAALSEPRPWWQQTRQVLLAIAAALTTIGLVIEQLASDSAAIPLFAAAMLAGGFMPARSALASLRRRSLTINTLLVTGALGAAALGLWEEAAGIVVIFSLGEVMEIYATDRARRNLTALMDLTPPEAILVRDAAEQTVPVETVRIGDIIRIKPGGRVPLDGVVVGGESAVEEAAITGEAMPVDKRAGDRVFAGTLNRQGTLTVQVTADASGTTLAQIIHTVEEARAHKSSYEHFGERFGAIYTPAMFGLAALVATVPWLLFDQPAQPWLYRALVVLVISCSCGLVLSVPTATLAAISNGARRGLVIKGGAYLERADQIDTVAFDKTGTLTTGSPVVSDVIPLAAGAESELLRLAAGVERGSEHPLAAAIVQAAEQRELDIEPVSGFAALTGLGVTGNVGGRRVWVGSPRLAREHGVADGALAAAHALEHDGKTVVVVWTENDTAALGLIAITDPLRAEARGAIDALRRQGIPHVVMLTGDNQRTADAIAHQAGIDEVYAELLPDDKIRIVRELQAAGRRVAMVGDGINDGPALAQADVGIAMGTHGTDVARETSDIVLMDDDLRRLGNVFALGRRATHTIRQNVYISVALVAILVPTALLGFIDLVPGIAINEGSAIAVIANGLRLLRMGDVREPLPAVSPAMAQATEAEP